jgi:hypothetical protein
MRTCLRFLVTILLFCASAAAARADGGTLRLSEHQGGYRISVFTSPTPWRAGPVDVSVLVQDAITGDPRADVAVTITLSSLDQPDTSFVETATAGSATNRLFQAAEFELPRAGRWWIGVAVRGPLGAEACGFELLASEALPSWLRLSRWIGWPAGVILLFAIHQVLVRRHGRSSGPGPWVGA